MSRIHPRVREQVRQRAGSRCEYCRKPEMYSYYAFHADHIIPPRHNGSDDVSNLAWACFACNISKGSDIASYDSDSGELTPLFNPRAQRWEDHFELNDFRIVGKTAVGRVTIRLLQLNHPDQIETRRALAAAGLW